jgi:hypothetical protein
MNPSISKEAFSGVKFSGDFLIYGAVLNVYAPRLLNKGFQATVRDAASPFRKADGRPLSKKDFNKNTVDKLAKANSHRHLKPHTEIGFEKLDTKVLVGGKSAYIRNWVAYGIEKYNQLVFEKLKPSKGLITT